MQVSVVSMTVVILMCFYSAKVTSQQLVSCSISPLKTAFRTAVPSLLIMYWRNHYISITILLLLHFKSLSKEKCASQPVSVLLADQ